MKNFTSGGGTILVPHLLSVAFLDFREFLSVESIVLKVCSPEAPRIIEIGNPAISPDL